MTTPSQLVQSDPRAPDLLLGSVHLAGTRRALERVRSALREALPGAPVGNRMELARYLGINGKLAGQVARALASASLEGFAASLPPYRGLHMVGERVPAGGEALLDASGEVERAIGAEVGERWLFDSMFARFNAPSDGEETATEVEPRKTAFRCYVTAFGHLTETLQRALVLRRSETSAERFDIIEIARRQGVVRTVPGLVIPVHAGRVVASPTADRDPQYAPPRRAIFAAPDTLPVGAVPAWCTPTDPPMRSRQTKGGLTILELCGDAIGEASRTDITLAHALPEGMSAYRGTTASGEPVHFSAGLHVTDPVAAIDLCIIIERALARQISVEFRPTQRPPLEHGVFDNFEYPLSLPLPHRQHRLDPRQVGGETREFDRLVAETLIEAGWAENQYVVHSTFTRYPLPQSTLWSWLELPDPPTV